MLTEGFDQPDISCIIIARPTQSQALYIQMVGRGIRLSPGKKDCVVIDMVGATERNDLITMPSLYGTKNGETITDAKEREKQEEQEREKDYPLEIDGKLVSEIRDLFNRSLYNWGESNREITSDMEKAPCGSFQSRIHGISSIGCQMVRQSFWRYPRHFRAGQDWAEENLRSRGKGAITIASKQAEWKKEPATQKQINFLRWKRIRFSPGLSKGEASRLIAAHKAREGF